LGIDLMECIRCGGSGKIKKFSHVDNGNCFECNGNGYTLKGNERLVEFLDENKNVIGRVFCTSETPAKQIKQKALHLNAKSMRMKKPA
jgi:recombinational DNA repair protein (RecF pathway)